MKRRVLSLMVTLALCLNLCPVWVLAVDGDQSDSGKAVLERDLNQDAPSEVSEHLTYDLAGHTITAPNSDAIVVKPTGVLELTGGGTINSHNNAAVRVESDGTLTIKESNTELIGGPYALYVASGAHVSLASGTYTAMGAAIQMEQNGDLGALLASGYAFFDSSGNQLSPEAAKNASELTVAPGMGEPALAWESADPVSINYDGRPVEPGNLPKVIITGMSDGEALRGELRYSYQEDGGSGYTDGLPTDAGTYTVIVSLPKTDSHYAAKSAPLTLTVNRINPIKTNPAAVQPTYNGSVQALVTAGVLDPVAVGDGLTIQFAESADGPWSEDIPTGVGAGEYHVWYRVTGLTDNYIEPNPNPAEIAGVKIEKKSITPSVTVTERSYVYDGAQKTPTITVRDGADVIGEEQYTVTWAGTSGQTGDEILRAAGTYTATVEGKDSGNYSFNETVQVEIVAADQNALTITGTRDPVRYGDIFTLGTTGGTGNGAVTWSIEPNDAGVTIDENTGKLTVNGVGTYTVKAERAVPNYGTVEASWPFTVEPKPVIAEVTVAAKTYDGTTDIADTAITAQVKAADLVNGETVTLSGLKGAYTDANAGTGKTVTLDSTGATADNTDKYAVSYPATAKGDITAKNVTVTVTLSDHDLKTDGNGQYYDFDGAEKEPQVTVTADDGATLAASDYDVAYANNKNVSTNGAKAAVTVTAKAGGNYTFADKTVNFEIRSTGAELTSSPQARELTYTGQPQELVTVGTATGGHIEYKLSSQTDDKFSTNIPTATDAGTYTVDYKVVGDGNHGDTAPAQVSVTIHPKKVSSPVITLEKMSYEYDGNAKTPTVTVKDGSDEVSDTEYSVSYRDNVNAGIATVIVSDANGGNYEVSGTATFEITKKPPTVTAPEGKTGLYYTGELQELVNAGVCNEGTVVYSVNGGNYSAAVPTASAVGTYNITWMVQGDDNHSDTTPATLSVEIAKNTVNNPTISLSSNQFTYDGNQHRPTVTVYDKDSRVIPEHEYTVDIKGTNGNVGMVNVDTYTVTVTTPDTSNYVISGNNTRTFEIVKADQETISVTGTPAQVRYGDVIQLGVSGGTGSGTVKWEITGNTDTALTQGGLLTVKDVNTSIKVTVTRSRANYDDVSASWEFTAAKKPVTAEVTVAAKNWDGNTNVANTAITATVKTADLAFTGDSITISGLTGTFDNANVGTGKTVTLTGGTVGGTNAEKYGVTIPATAAASILAVAATVDTEPAANTLTYDASQSQELVTAGSATGGTMVYSLDGTNFTPNIPKAKDADTYTVYYKAQGDQNHTDSEVKTKDVTIAQQTIAADDLQIELVPAWAQYDGQEHKPAVTVRDGDNNLIPDSEYKATYVTDGGKNWTDKGNYTVKVENITGGNYIITETEAEFEIKISAQAPLEIVNKPGLVYYGDTFHLSATGGSGSEKVTWGVDDAGKSVVDIDANGFVKIIGVGQATITATKAGGGNYDEATATYSFNALKKPVTATVTADDKVYDGNTNASIHITWRDGDLINGDTIQFNPDPAGTFDSDAVGTNKQVTVTATVVDDATSQKYDITIPPTTSASITKATATAPTVTAVPDLKYTGSAQTLVSGGNANTRYSDTRDGVYSDTVPTGTNAGTYTVWYKTKGDDNHNDSERQSIQVTISPKTLTLTAADITLSGSDLQGNATDGYYYNYDGTDKTPTVTMKDGAATVPAGEYTVTYSDNRNAGTATVTITDNEGGNYTVSVSGTVSFEIRAGGAQLTGSPRPNDLTYTGAAQELVSVGTAAGGHLEYKLTSAPTGETTSTSFSTSIPTGTRAGVYTVDYKVVGDDNHDAGPSGSVTVTIKPKTVISPQITVNGGPFTYNNGTPVIPTSVTVEDGGKTIPASEYTLSYQNNVNAGTATVIVTDNNGGNYTVNGTATFEIAKATAAVGTAPTGRTGLKYNGTAQELLDTLGTATDGTMVYSLSETGEYSAAIPTGKAVGEYEIWYKVLGDSNHTDSAATKLADKVKIEKNTVTNPTIQVTPASVTFNGQKQEPTVTVKDDDGLLIDGSEYTPAYADTANGNNSDLTAVGTYTVTITEVANGNYTFDATDGKNTAKFEILPADQTPLTITGTRERVYYGDTVQLGTTGGSSGGNVTWEVGSGEPASIDTNGLLKITGVGSVTVTATSSKTGYANQTATWALYADKKPVTAIVTAASKTYNDDADADVTATLQASDFVGTDNFTITLTGCTFEDANAGTDKKVNVVSTNPTFTVNAGGTDNHENYAITYPAAATASIFKANVDETKVTAPTAAAGLTYTGLPLTLVTAGTATGGTMEYSIDGINYSAGLPTGIDAGDYDVWYRVKGDGNHNDTTPVKLTETTQVTIAPQAVDADKLTIEFSPSGASYDGQEHKPAVTVKDGHNRVIPAEEYTVTYSNTDWKTASSAAVKHEVTVTDNNGGNYTFTAKTVEFTISMMGQNPLSITNQPGEVRYGDSFTLSTTGGSGTGNVTWTSSDTSVATIGANGLVKTLKSGATTITATKQADANYGAVSVTWALSVEKKLVTATVTADDREYRADDTTATIHVTWNGLVGNDSITLSLTGTFDNANVGTNKTVTITGTAPADDRYDIKIPASTTASITATQATVSGVNAGPWIYSGGEISLLQGGAATYGTIVYSRNGIDFMETSPTETNAGKYTVYYRARGNANYADSEVRMVEVTIQPKTVSSPTIELSYNSVAYDGNPKEPNVTAVKDGGSVIPASEYTVSYSNNISVGTARVNITDVPGGNYTVSGSRNFTITAGAASLTNAPQANNRTYDGTAQPLVTAGSAVNGKVVYSLTQGSGYSTSIPVKTDADTYTVWYKVQGENGAADTTEDYVTVTIARKAVTPTVLVGGQSSYSVTYTGSAQTPAVTVIVDGKPLTQNVDYTALYSNNTNVGTATVTVQSTGGNYQFYVPVTFKITKGKATFLREPQLPVDDLYYTGEPQELVRRGTANNGGIVLYSLDNVAYSTAIPTGIDRGAYTVYAKIQASELYAESDVVILDVEIGKNVVTDPPDYDLSATNFPYTGSEVQPTVTLWDDDGYEIDSSEYTLRYSNNIAVGTATIKVTCKRNGNYSFNQFSITFQIVDASQTPLAITGKQDTVYYGDTLSLGTTGGDGSGTVTWNATGPVDKLGDGQYKVTSSGSVTITATKGSSTDAWTFYAKPKPITATVYAADKVYDGNNNATLTVALSGLISGDNVATNTEDGVKATGQFTDTGVGTRTVIITLTVPAAVSEKYDISCNSTTTASITPAAAGVTTAPTLAGSLTYNGGAQPLLANGGTADGGNLMYSLDGREYSYIAPTGTDAKTYTVWYKVEASDDNHKDSAPVKLGDVTIAPNVDAPKVRCNPGSFPYDGTAKTPAVVVLDSTGQHIIPESEYTVTFAPSPLIAVGKYAVTVTDKPGGNYEFSSKKFENVFEIVASSQAPVSITDKPASVHYGGTFHLSATGGSGSGAVKWSIAESSVATVNDSGAVTVKDTGSFTVKAYRQGDSNYGDSNTDSVTFVAQPKPVTPVVTANDKPYDGNTNAELTATLRDSDLVNGDTITLAVSGVFASSDAGTGKRVNITSITATGTNADKYTINWPDSVTATINRVDAKIAATPAAISGLREDGSDHQLVSAGTTENNIGTVVYSLNDQNGTYSESIPKAAAAGTYTVWYKVADSVNYNGVPAASVRAEIQVAPTPAPPSGDTNSDTGTGGAGTSDTGTGISSDTLSTYSTPARTTVRNGAASTVLSASEGASLVRQAAANQSQNIVVQPKLSGDVTKSEVSIPASTVGQIQSQTDAALTVSAPIADVTIPNGALDTLSSAGGTVNVAAEQVGDAVKLTLTAGGEAVNEVPGGVTLTVPAEDAGPGTVAVLVNEDGSRQVIQKSVARDGAVDVPLSGSATVEIVDNSKEFEDVSSTGWEADAVAFASAHELFSGTSETTFSPDESMSRGMLATVLYNLEDHPDQDGAVTFSDVSSDAWYSDSVAWAAENGIVNGYGDGQFGPDDSITREQFAVMLWNYAGKPEAGGQALDFKDADQVSGYARAALSWAVENGILNGYDGRLTPGATATRAQAAQMLKNFMENT